MFIIDPDFSIPGCSLIKIFALLYLNYRHRYMIKKKT